MILTVRDLKAVIIKAQRRYRMKQRRATFRVHIEGRQFRLVT